MEKGRNMQVNGRMINGMVKVLKLGPMDQSIQEIITWKRRMAKVIINGQMVQSIMENGLTIR